MPELSSQLPVASRQWWAIDGWQLETGCQAQFERAQPVHRLSRDMELREAHLKRWSLPHWTALFAIALLLNAIIVRLIPYQYDTPSREIVAILLAFSGFEFLIWSPLGAFVLVRFWRSLPLTYRIIIAMDLAYAAALIYSALTRNP